MAYKNQKKNKTHLLTLQNKDWRKANKEQNRRNKQRDIMSKQGLGQSEIEILMKIKGII